MGLGNRQKQGRCRILGLCNKEEIEKNEEYNNGKKWVNKEGKINIDLGNSKK